MSAGIATNHWWWRTEGTVGDLCREHEANWSGDYGVGHVRYCTDKNSNIQPVVDLETRQALAFNGQVENGDTNTVFAAVRDKYKMRLSTLRGAYCFAFMDAERGTVVAGRDPHGFHPLFYSPSMRAVASEPCALPSVLDWRPVAPGTTIDVGTGKTISERLRPKKGRARCFFEMVYFSSVESHFDGHGVWETRRRLGYLLAEREDVEADVVVPVPDSGIAAAQAMSEQLGVPLRSAIYRDRYAERTFINEGGQREKYRIIPQAILGKRILLVDDSIVRGHTLNHLVPQLQQFASEVHVRVTCPPITHACPYGIRITGKGAHTIEKADSVRFLEPDDVDIFDGTCRACVTGAYPIEPCRKCGGAGWVWCEELDNPHDCEPGDDTKYSCDRCCW
jgi:amidophosphoribosyltransferase